jgi:hypothetical protein
MYCISCTTKVSGFFPFRIPNPESRIQKTTLNENSFQFNLTSEPEGGHKFNKIEDHLLFRTGHRKIFSQFTKNLSILTQKMLLHSQRYVLDPVEIWVGPEIRKKLGYPYTKNLNHRVTHRLQKIKIGIQRRFLGEYF